MNVSKPTSKFQRPRFQRGATAVEYAIVASLIAALIVVALVSISTKTGGHFNLLDAAW